MPTDSLHGKKVVIIGGSSGIGFGVAIAARDAGANIVIGSSKAVNVESAIARLGETAQGSAVNVTDEADVARFFEGIGAFDHLVYTAGDWGGRRPVPPAEWDLAALGALFAVRFWGAVMAVKHSQPTIAQDGSITLTDGALAHRPRKGASVSSAMLAAVEHLARGLAVDLAPVRVNAVCPGLVLTEAVSAMSPEQIQGMTGRQPLPRAGQPAELAEAYLYLMRGTYTTGQVLRVDGGSALT